MRIAAERFQRLEIVAHARIDARLHHGRHRVVLHLLREPLGERPGLVVHVPVEGLGEVQALRGFQTDRLDVGEEQQQRRELLAALDDAELGRLLDRVGGVAAGIGKADDLGLGGLRLEQEGREVRRVERMLDAADDLAAVGGDDGGGVALERRAEGVVGGQEEPGVATGLHQRLARGVGQHVGVVGPVHGVGRALRVGEVGGRRTRIDVDAVLFLDDVVDGERHAGIRHVDDDVDLVDVEPLPRDRGADIRLVLVIARDDVDLPALRGEAGIFNGHLRGERRAGPAEVGIETGLIGQRADLDGLVLREGRASGGDGQRRAEQTTMQSTFSCYFPREFSRDRPTFGRSRRRDRCGACPCWRQAPHWKIRQ